MSQSAMSVINYNPTTKEEIAVFVDKIVSEVEIGAVNALELYIKMKAIESCFEQIQGKIRESIMNEVDVYTEKEFELFGAKVSKAETGTKYDYSVSNDTYYNDLAANKKRIDTEMKEREKLIKAAPATGLEIVNPDTGEVEKIFPPIKSSSTFIKVSLK